MSRKFSQKSQKTKIIEAKLKKMISQVVDFHSSTTYLQSQKILALGTTLKYFFQSVRKILSGPCMSRCEYIYVYICACEHVYACKLTIGMCICMYKYIRIYIYIYIYVCVCVCVCVSIYGPGHIYVGVLSVCVIVFRAWTTHLLLPV